MLHTLLLLVFKIIIKSLQCIFNYNKCRWKACLMLSKPAFTCSKLTKETVEQRCEICSKLTIKTPKRRRHRFGVFFVNFEHISHLGSSVSIVRFEHVITSYFLVIMHLKRMKFVLIVKPHVSNGKLNKVRGKLKKAVKEVINVPL